nr:S24 family peptidase [Acaryochloris sp. IP29b_bin.137]
MLIRSIHSIELADSLCLPLLSIPVSAGFPSPADDHLQSELNLQDALIHHPAATFFMRVEGDSMEGCGIFGFVQIWPKMGNTRMINQAIFRNDQSRFYCFS